MKDVPISPAPEVASAGSATPLPPIDSPSSQKASETVDLDSAPAANQESGPGGATVDFVAGAASPNGQGADPHLTVDPAQDGPVVLVEPTSKADTPGHRPKVIAGYEILGVLGRGAMGVVYQARQRGLKRLVALKMILSGEEASDHELARFKIEAEAIGRIQHPNIVQIYEVGEHEGRPYFSLEYVEGGSLAGKVKGEPQTPREAARIVGLLAAGMDCAHRAGIIHRDLKPANVLLAKDGTPKITDFGLAKRLEEDGGRTVNGVIMGTPTYMSPEQAEGRISEVGPLADVYALGVILYELLTGRVPFKGSTLFETLEQVRTREPVRPSDLQLNVPRDLETICLKCIQKDRNRRYSDAAALGEDLRRFLNNEPILARPVGRLERTWRWCQRNPKLAGLTVGIFLVLVLWASSMTLLSFNLKWEKDKVVESEIREKASKDKAIKEGEFANKTATNTLGLLAQQSAGSLSLVNARIFKRELVRDPIALRDEMLALLRGMMVNLASDLEASEASTFGSIRNHEIVGDILKSLGLREEALKQFRLAQELAEKAVQEQPTSDKAKANLGVILLHLGEMNLELYGEAPVARDYYEKGRKLRQEVADHPQSGDFTERDTRIQLSHYEILLGQADLIQGDPKGARAHFQKALELRTAWWEETPDLPEARSYLVQAHVCLGIVAWHLGDDSVSNDAFAKALRIQDELVKNLAADPKHSKDGLADYYHDLADVLARWGDGQRAQGKLAEAESTYRRSLQAIQQTLDLVPGNAEYYLQFGLILEGLASIVEARGDRSAAEEGYQDALNVFRGLLKLDENNTILKSNALRVSAHSDAKKVEGALGQLEKLSQSRPQSIPLLLNVARCSALGTQSTTDTQKKAASLEKTLEALNKAVELGYRDRVALKTDPDLQRLRDEPRLTSFLDALAKR